MLNSPIGEIKGFFVQDARGSFRWNMYHHIFWNISALCAEFVWEEINYVCISIQFATEDGAGDCNPWLRKTMFRLFYLVNFIWDILRSLQSGMCCILVTTVVYLSSWHIGVFRKKTYQLIKLARSDKKKALTVFDIYMYIHVEWHHFE